MQSSLEIGAEPVASNGHLTHFHSSSGLREFSTKHEGDGHACPPKAYCGVEHVFTCCAHNAYIAGAMRTKGNSSVAVSRPRKPPNGATQNAKGFSYVYVNAVSP
eukprot:6096725-Amphidinium_carterae.1